MEQSIVQIGNSVGLIIPKEVKEKLGLKKGSKVVVEVSRDSKSMVISRVGTARGATITPEFLEWLSAFNKEYGPALDELAKK